MAARSSANGPISTQCSSNNAYTIDLDSIRREWANVSLGEEARTAWLEAEILASTSPAAWFTGA